MQTCQQFATVALQLPKYFEISSGKLHETKNCDIEGHDLTTKRTVDRCLKFKIGTDISNKRSTWPGKKKQKKKNPTIYINELLYLDDNCCFSLPSEA